MKRVKARKDAISERSRIGVEKMLRGLEKCDCLHRSRTVPVGARSCRG